MSYEDDVYRPIKTFGYFLIGIGSLGFIALFTVLRDVDFNTVVSILVVVIACYHILLGIGIILRSRMIFRLFRGYLNILYLGFPIGTYLSRHTLRYIDENRIERFLR